MTSTHQPPGEGPPFDSLPVSDDEALDRLRRWGGDKLVEQMVEIFLTQSPVRVTDARTAFENGSARELERAVHALRSSSAQLGAARIQALCEVIEPRAAGGDLAGLGELIASLEDEMKRYEAQTRS